MAYVITTVLLKGGVSKSTVSMALAHAATYGTDPSRVKVIDTDPMSGSFMWSQLAAQAGMPVRAMVIPMGTEDLHRRVEAERRSADLIVIDGPAPGALRIARSAIAEADFVVMPVPPELAAVHRVPPTIEIVRELGKPVKAVLTMVRGRLSGERDQAMELLESWGVPVFKTELPLAVEVQRNYGAAVTGALSRFGFDLMTEILEGEAQINA